MDCFIFSIGRLDVPMKKEDGEDEMYATTRGLVGALRLPESDLREHHENFGDRFTGTFEGEGKWSRSDCIQFMQVSPWFYECIKGTEAGKSLNKLTAKFLGLPEEMFENKTEQPS